MSVRSDFKIIHFSNSVSAFYDGGLLQVTISNAPVSAISAEIRDGLMQAMDMAETYGLVKAVVIRGERKLFAAGLDIKEHDLPSTEPTLPQVTARIEAFPKPVIVVVNGSALGDGYEIVLACHYRIASKTAKFGLPEAERGLVRGETRYLSRLKEPAVALNTARMISAQEALGCGLIDEIVAQENLTATICTVATRLAGVKLRCILEVKPQGAEQARLALLTSRWVQ
ncbi:MAG: enoyl-CoA hydratase/isomerase family protein [Brucellaceae bacterium]|nr:enoyl-CoA hydratase/isomerase family protein [Brucellaceae bacterium]